METQIVDIADEIAYDNHDIDDGLTSGLLKEQDLEKVVLWNNINKEISKKYAKIVPERKKYLIIRSLIDMQVTDLISQTEKNTAKLKLKSYLDIKKLDKKIVSFSKPMQDCRKPLREFLLEKLYHHYRVIRMADKAKRFIKELFRVYVARPESLPLAVQNRIPAEGVRRTVCDYIAGMTDRYALDEYKKLFYPYEKV
jgi:dGTPase